MYTSTWVQRCMYTGLAMYVHMLIGSAVYLYMYMGSAIMCTGTGLSGVCIHVYMGSAVYTHGFSCVHTCTWAERCMYTHVHGSAMYASVQRRQLSSRARCVTTFDADVNRCVGGHGVTCDRFLREKKGFLTLCLTLTVRGRATVSHANRSWKR